VSYATDLADALDKVTMPGPVSKELRRLAAENESLVNALAYIEGLALADDPRDLAGIVKTARAAIDALNEQEKQK
jgi:hypothetical protein